MWRADADRGDRGGRFRRWRRCAAAAKLDKPAKSYATGFGAKFDAQFQNTRAFPTVVQWQSGKIVTVFPKEAAQPNVKLVNLPRK
jgi:hypothetical protein